MWKGPSRKFESDNQAYYTDPALADRVVAIAKERAPKKAIFLDVGVGQGALYERLPSPKHGVELESPTRALKGVEYNTDIFEWRAPASWKTKHVCVVMNPPFNKQIEILNQVNTIECRTLTVVWIAGLSIRLWENEDKVHPYLHLEAEWLTPPQWSKFDRHGTKRNIHTAVQVWVAATRRVRCGKA